MAEVIIRAGAKYDIPTLAEIAAEIERQQEIENTRLRERLRGFKRMEVFIPVSPAATSVFIGQSIGSNAANGPEQGQVWSVRIVGVVLASTGTLTVYKSSSDKDSRRPVFYNGTGQPVQVAMWSSDQLRLRFGEGLYIVGSANLSSVFMSAWQLPAEREAEFA